MSAIGVIGGTGVYDPSIFENIHEESLMTPYGEIDYVQGTYHGKTVIFVARHGKDHTIPPHKINYRANIWGLKKLGVTFIISTTAVGSLNENFKPGHFVLTDQFLDFTKNRITTFYEGGDRPVAHLDVTNPYCSELRDILQKVGTEQGLTIHNGGTYVCTEGPRFETPAEIKMFHMLGGDTVGMTNVPEVNLANEAEMAYSTISMITNYAAGISEAALTHAEVVEMMADMAAQLKSLILGAIDAIDVDARYDAHYRMHDQGLIASISVGVKEYEYDFVSQLK
ncbi:MAG: S-methyl-5'-thioadenosine phosphorylase, partial [Veillonella parvula]